MKADREELVRVKGLVAAPSEEGRYEVRLDSGETIIAGVDRMMRRIGVAILVGDRVTLEMPPSDLSRARITFRHLAIGTA